MDKNLRFSSPKYHLDDLQIKGFKLLQNTKGFCLGTDSVLLADFSAKLCPKGGGVIEAGCGNGAVCVLMAARREDIDLIGVELQEDAAALAEYNAKLNKLENRFKVINSDIRNLDGGYTNRFDMFVTNPPYTPKGRGITSPTLPGIIARSESEMSFSDAAKAAKRMLKDKGKFVFVNKASRIAEIISVLRENSLEPKLMRFVHSSAEKKAYLVMISASKNGGSQCEIAPPLVIYGQDGNYTKEIYDIYNMDKTEE